MAVHKKLISNVNDLTVVKFATSKNLNVKSLMLPKHNKHKYTWTAPDGNTHNQIDHIFIHRRWRSSVSVA
jgi:hypothetical protein